MEKHISAATWMLYLVYEWTIWPVGTFFLGYAAGNIIWSALAALPIVMVSYGSDRKRQKEKDKPASRLNSIVLISVIQLALMLGIYFFGFSLSSL